MKDTADIRKVNKNKIRRILWQGGEYTKQNIAIKTSLSVATCNTLLNEMEKSGELCGTKQQLQGVGRSTVVYRINEYYKSILCVRVEVVKKKKTLRCSVVSPLGNIIHHSEEVYEYLDYETVENSIKKLCDIFPSIAQIMVGLPGVVENGIIRHCDIEELEDVPFREKMENNIDRQIYLGNNMHFKAYGYYKKSGIDSDIITLAYFAENIIPGLATVYKGTIIKGANQFAGTLGFLPYGIGLKEQMNLWKKDKCFPLMMQIIPAIIVLINPNIIVFTGDLIDRDLVEKVRKECIKNIPEENMPLFYFRENDDIYYLTGLYQKALDLREKI